MKTTAPERMSKNMARPLRTLDPLKVAKVIGELGGTEEKLAAALGITRQALTYRKKTNPEFFASLKAARAIADECVEKSLYQRANGYDRDGKHYPADVTACIFWLKNRRPQQWREKSEADITLRGMPEDLVKAIQERAAQKAKTNGSTDHAVTRA